MGGLTSLGPEVVAVCPKFLVSGLLVHLGLGYVLEGLWDPRKVIVTLAPSEYGIVLTILFVSLVEGLPEAMITGLMLLSFLFVLRYGQGEVVQLACSAHEIPSLRSRRYRTTSEWDSLQPLLSRIFVIQTNASHLFFGSISVIMSTARPWLSNHAEGRRFLLLDLAVVQSIDTSAVTAIRQNATQVTVLICGLRSALVELLREANAMKGLRCFNSLDLALEFCEDQLLQEAGLGFGRQGAAATVPALGSKLSQSMSRVMVETHVPAPLQDGDALILLQRCLPGLSNAVLNAVLDPRNSTRVSFVKGAVVAEEGTICQGMILCLRGTLAFYSGPVRLPYLVHESIGVDPSVKSLVGSSQAGPGSVTGSHLCELGPGDTCGMSTLLNPLPLTHLGSLVAETECELLVLGRRFVLSMETSTDLRPALDFHKALTLRLMTHSEPHLVGTHSDHRSRSFTDIAVGPFMG